MALLGVCEDAGPGPAGVECGLKAPVSREGPGHAWCLSEDHTVSGMLTDCVHLAELKIETF